MQEICREHNRYFKVKEHMHDRGAHRAILSLLPLILTSPIYKYFVPGVIQEGAGSQVLYLAKKERKINKSIGV